MTVSGWAAAAGARALVFPAADASTDNSRLRIDGADGHHLQRVRRIELHETIVVADARGGWYTAEVVGLGDGAVDVERTGPNHVEPVNAPTITIAFAPAKSDHGTEVVHQLVELGVDRVIPTLMQRSVVRWDGSRAAKAHDRLRRIAREAAMQSHRARIPIVEAPISVASLAGHPGLVVAERGGRPIAELAEPRGGERVVVIGPEGGLAPEERSALGEIATIGIGGHVLRSVTAPVAVAAVLAARRRC